MPNRQQKRAAEQAARKASRRQSGAGSSGTASTSNVGSSSSGRASNAQGAAEQEAERKEALRQQAILTLTDLQQIEQTLYATVLQGWRDNQTTLTSHPRKPDLDAKAAALETRFNLVAQVLAGRLDDLRNNKPFDFDNVGRSLNSHQAIVKAMQDFMTTVQKVAHAVALEQIQRAQAD